MKTLFKNSGCEIIHFQGCCSAHFSLLSFSSPQITKNGSARQRQGGPWPSRASRPHRNSAASAVRPMALDQGPDAVLGGARAHVRLEGGRLG